MIRPNFWYSPWLEVVFVLDSEHGLRVESLSIVEEAVKGTEPAAGIIEEVMGERHLVDGEVLVKW